MNQFFLKFFGTRNSNPHDLENWNETPNPFNMTPEKIDQIIYELEYDVRSVSWHERMGKNQSKRNKVLKARANEMIHLS